MHTCCSKRWLRATVNTVNSRGKSQAQRMALILKRQAMNRIYLARAKVLISEMRLRHKRLQIISDHQDEIIRRKKEMVNRQQKKVKVLRRCKRLLRQINNGMGICCTITKSKIKPH